MSDELERAVDAARNERQQRELAAERTRPAEEERERQEAARAAGESERLRTAAIAFVRRARAAGVEPHGRVSSINGVKPSFFSRRPVGWCIGEGSPMSWGGGYPAIYVLEDGRVVHAGSALKPDRKRPKISVIDASHIAGAPDADVGGVIEAMGQFLARHDA